MYFLDYIEVAHEEATHPEKMLLIDIVKRRARET